MLLKNKSITSTFKRYNSNIMENNLRVFKKDDKVDPFCG